MEAVAEARNVFRDVGLIVVERRARGVFKRRAGLLARDDIGEDLHRLLAGTTMHIAEDVGGGRHGVVDADAARHRHAGDGDGRSLRPVIDASHQHRGEQIGLVLARHGAAQHQPDHLREIDIADQLLDRKAAHTDRTRLDIDDFRTPPVGGEFLRRVAHMILFSFSSAISAALTPRDVRMSSLC